MSDTRADTRAVTRASALHGSLRVPGDKSASHRALMLSALAEGESTIVGLSQGRDVQATSDIMVLLGARRAEEDTSVTILGPPDGLRASDHDLDCGNSGTTMRLLSGVVSTVAGTHTLVGDESLSRRPMDRVAVPLQLMGALVTGQGARVTAPLSVKGGRSLVGITYEVPIASAQVKSAILFAALGANGPTTVREAVRTRTTSEDMMERCGLSLRRAELEEGVAVTIQPGRPTATAWRIAGDPSQAAFFAVLGAIHDCAVIEVLDIDGSAERLGFVDVLSRMGATLSLAPSEVGVTLCSQSSQLVATEVLSHEIPSLDEVPVLAVAAAAASGVSVFRDMGELRLKESNRFDASMALARALGCRVWDEGEDFFIEGLGAASAFQPFDFEAGLDHRLVMASAVAGSAGSGCTISGADTVSSSYPGFFQDLVSLS